VQNENRSGVRRFRAICSKFLKFTMCLYGLINEAVNVSDYVNVEGKDHYRTRDWKELRRKRPLPQEGYTRRLWRN